MEKHKHILHLILHRRNPMFFKSTEHGMVAMVPSSCIEPGAFRIHDSSTEFTLQDAMDSEAKLPDLKSTVLSDGDDADPSFYIEDYPHHEALLKIPTQDESLHHKYGRHHSPNSVSYTTAEILYFNTVLGNSPGVSAGLPISLGNKCLDRETVEVTELDGPPLQHANWGGDDPMRIPAGARRNMLIDEGVPSTELKRYAQFQALQKKNPYYAQRTYPDLA